MQLLLRFYIPNIIRIIGPIVVLWFLLFILNTWHYGIPPKIDVTIFDSQFQYWSIANRVDYLTLMCGSWVVIVLGLSFILGLMYQRKNPISGWILRAIVLTALSTPFAIGTFLQSRNRLAHIESQSFNNKTYQLARFEQYMEWNTKSGAVYIFECDLTGQICTKLKTLTSFPLEDGYTETATFEIGDNGTTLYTTDGNVRIVIATQTSN